MHQVIQNLRTGKLTVEEVPAPALRAGGALVQTHHSLISTGTERAVVEFSRRGLAGKARARPDLVREVWNKVLTDGPLATYRAVTSRLETPVPLGYSSAGIVLEVGTGVSGVGKSDRVACAGGGHACHAEVAYVPKNLMVPIPENVSTQEAAFVALGAIALQGIHRAELTPGERVAVIGLGLVGQLTVQTLLAYGFPVMGLDVDPRQVEKAKESGLPLGGVIGQEDIEGIASAFSGGIGVDAVILTAATPSDDPVRLAGQICRERGRVSAVGEVGMRIPRDLYYAKELDLRVSRSYGPGRYDPQYEEQGIDYPIGYARWTERRNMEEFLRLVSLGRVNVKAVTTHTFPLEEAPKAYELILNNRQDEPVGGVLLEYSQDSSAESKVTLASPAVAPPGLDQLSVGLIGAGNFARGVILPNLASLKNVRLHAVASATGQSAAQIARSRGSTYATSRYQELLEDEVIRMVIVATRHNLHALIAVEALKKGKSVYVEKPLALSLQELQEVAQVAHDSPGLLMVGFNRRFSPFTLEIRQWFQRRTTPLMLNYRVNAGEIPPESWLRDPVEGGGRIVGEVCHFVDLLQFLVSAPPVRVHATRPRTGDTRVVEDNVLITLEFADGSCGTIQYTSLGDEAVAKEYLEVFGDGKTAILDNFRSLRLYRGRRARRIRRLNQDKGHRGMLEAFSQALLKGGASPIPLEELLLTTLTTFQIEDSLRRREPVAIDLRQMTEG